MKRYRVWSSNSMMTTTRRDWLHALAAACLSVTATRSTPVHASSAARPTVRVHDNAMAALLASVGGVHLSIEVDTSVSATTVVIDGQTVDLTKNVLLKGSGVARDRFLDDPRNALKLAPTLRDRLGVAHPELRAKLAEGHAAWSKSFVKRVFAWQTALKQSRVRNAKLRDRYDRIYLLQWAGASIDPNATIDPPATLAKVPLSPASATPAAYAAYVDTLVRAIA